MPEEYTASNAAAADKVTESPQAPSTPAVLKLKEETLTELTNWLSQWLEMALSDLEQRKIRYLEFEKQYQAETLASRNFPFEGASKVVVPVTAMAVDPIYSRLMTGVFNPIPVYVGRPLKPGAEAYVSPLQDWVEFYIRRISRLPVEGKSAFLELVNLGTCVFKPCYEELYRKIKKYGPDGETIIDEDELVRKGPVSPWIPLEDFIIPEPARDVQTAPLVGHVVRASWWQLKALEYSKKITNLDKIKGHFEAQLGDVESQRLTDRGVSPTYVHEYKLYELYFDYDIDGSGQSTRLVALYHHETRTFLQLRYNWYFHQRRPFVVIPYFPRPGSIWGVGIAEMTAGAQEEVTTMHRQRSDNATLANVRMFVAKKNCGIERVPRLYPGRTFFVDDPDKDFRPFAAADVYQSTVLEEQMLFGYMEKRTGVSDYLLGRESPLVGSRATATSTLALIQEGTKRVQQTVDEVRTGMTAILEYYIEIWYQYGVGTLPQEMLGDQRGKLVADFLSQPNRQEVQGAVGFDLNVTSAALNKEVQKQTLLALVQILQGYYDRLFMAANIAAQPQTPPLVLAAVESISKAQDALFKRTIELFDVKNFDELLPNLEVLSAIAAATRGNGQGGVPGGVGGPPGAENVPGMVPGMPGGSGSPGGGTARFGGAPAGGGRPSFLPGAY